MSQSQSPDPTTQILQSDAERKLGAVMLQFVQVDDYTTFKAEFANSEGDLVFHFFKTPEVERLPDVRGYWGVTFAAALEEVAKRVFNADAPRIQGQHMYDQEMGLDSWWFRANGYGHLLDPYKLVYSFLDTLDEALDKTLSTSRT